MQVLAPSISDLPCGYNSLLPEASQSTQTTRQHLLLANGSTEFEAPQRLVRV